MKVLVPVKSVLDYATKIKVKADGSGVEKDGIKQIVNPFDEIAVEEAVRLKDAGKISEITVIGVGTEETATQLRYAMAMGADQAILIKSTQGIDSDLAARALAEIFRRGEYQLIIMGKQAIDSDSGQTPQLLAGYLDLPHASFASKIELSSDSVKVTREVDGGLEIVEAKLPAIISTDLRLNEPRYASLPGIMKAKKKPLEEIELSAVVSDLAEKVKFVKYFAPPARKAGRKVTSVDELIGVLRNEAKVI